MKVLYDYQAFQMQRFGGISRYFAEIIDHLPEDVCSEISVRYSDNEYLIKKGLMSGIESLYDPGEILFHGLRLPGRRTVLNYLQRLHVQKYQEPSVLNKQLAIERLKAQDFDVFHPTYYDDYFLEFLGTKPFVLTIHDMIHEIYPEFFNDIGLLRNKRILAEKAAHIIAVSENTKNDIVKILGISPKKITVIYHSSLLNEHPRRNEEKLNLPDKYILFVGDRSAYKNFFFFLQAVLPILENDPSLNIVCAGKVFNTEEIRYIKMIGLEEKIKVTTFIDDNMYELYNRSQFFVFPSYYEGFGIPIIEAFLSDCPVLLSNTSCFPEIAGDSALYFTPKNICDFRHQMDKLLSDRKMARELTNKAKVRGALFSWDKSAAQTCDVYKKCL